MIKIWAKIYKGDKILKQTVFKQDGEMDYSEFFNHLKTICDTLDIACPVLIKQHIFSYAKYNTVKFTQADFLDSISFDKLVLENINR